MKSNKDISDLIRENAHKLEERPSKRAWERLENRLDQRPVKRRFSLRYLSSMAAAVVGLVALVSVISFIFQSKASDMAVMDKAEAADFVVEKLEVEVLSEEDRGFYKVVEFQNTYQDRLANPKIEEGSGKKLAVAKFVNSEAKPPVNIGKGAKKKKVTTKKLTNEEKFNEATTKLRYAPCIRFANLKKYKASIIYHSDKKACRYPERISSEPMPSSDVIEDWKDAEEVEKIVVQGSIQLLLDLDFITESEVVLSAKTGEYQVVVSRADLIAYFGKSISQIQKTWNPDKVAVVNSATERKRFLERFGSVER